MSTPSSCCDFCDLEAAYELVVDTLPTRERQIPLKTCGNHLRQGWAQLYHQHPLVRIAVERVLMADAVE